MKHLRAWRAALLPAAFAATVAAAPDSPGFGQALAAAAGERTRLAIRYDGSYRRIAYPLGDVPDDVGVCTDLVVRSYRRLGIDLQQRVHEDMRARFDRYPALWGLQGPDPNIDHRRMPNLVRYFERRGASLPATDDPRAYLPGDLVTWRLPGNLPHIGIVAAERGAGGSRPLVTHNIGAGPRTEDVLFEYPITGHYRYPPPKPGAAAE